ncbi:hypothetical protein [Dickeya fangzhongdai]|uniref:hypothetical protein n=1 Tax=Dickeya fangzhongdai TaxID=1778540 RepID=UPI00103B7E38|nr:hypothetical protein [Dickeya fangzhongdai]
MVIIIKINVVFREAVIFVKKIRCRGSCFSAIEPIIEIFISFLFAAGDSLTVMPAGAPAALSARQPQDTTSSLFTNSMP